LGKSDPLDQAPRRAVSPPNALEDCQQQLPKTETGEQNARKGAKKATTLCKTFISHTPPASANEGSRGQLPGFNTENRDDYPPKMELGQNTQTHEPDREICDIGPEITGFIKFTLAATSERTTRSEQEISERYHTHPTKIFTDQSNCNGTSITVAKGTGRHPAANSEETVEAEGTKQETSQQEPPLSKTEAASIEKRRRRQARANGQGKSGTACFTGNTLILVIKRSRAKWIPI